MQLRSQQGSALVLVLVVITILTMLVSTVIAVDSVQHRFIQRDVKQLQALYLAEAGLHFAMDLLESSPNWEIQDTIVGVTEGKLAHLSVEGAGGYYRIRARAGQEKNAVSIEALVGQAPPAPFARALYLWDKDARLNVAGAARIYGDIEMGRLGIRQNSIGGVRFSGEIASTVHYNPDIKAPVFDDRLFRGTMDRMDALINEADRDRPVHHERTRQITSSKMFYTLPKYYFDGDLIITEADSHLLNSPHVIVASGDLVLEGAASYSAGAYFIAGDKLSLRGGVSGRHGLFYGVNGLFVEGRVQCSGQFISRNTIQLKDEVYLTHPSVLFLAEDINQEADRISLDDHSRIDGSVIVGTSQEKTDILEAKIVVEPDALIRGAVFNADATTLSGTVYGSLLTRQLYFYQSPSHYVNWLLDAEINLKNRPSDFHLPVLFGTRPSLKIISWEKVKDEA